MTTNDTISQITQALEFIKVKKEDTIKKYGTYYDINSRLKILVEAIDKYAQGAMMSKEDKYALVGLLDEIKDIIMEINIKEENNNG